MQLLSLFLAVFFGSLAAKFVAFKASAYQARYRNARYGNPIFPLKPGSTLRNPPREHQPVSGIRGRETA